MTVDFSVPKGSYEAKLDHIVKATHLERQEAAKPKVLREEKKEKETLLEQKQREKEEYEKKNAAKIKKQQKKKAKKAEAKKIEKKSQLSETLFVRNIGFETTEEKFKEFMEKFGPV
jgi:RNA recognition motif-containing protein